MFTRWVWAEYARAHLEAALATPPTEEEEAAGLDAPKYLFMFLRLGLLWALIEALTGPKESRRIVLAGRLAEDVTALSEPLKLIRDAVFHIPAPRQPYPDPRLTAVMNGPDAAARIERVHDGLRRLIEEELRRRPEYRSGRNRALTAGARRSR